MGNYRPIGGRLLAALACGVVACALPTVMAVGLPVVDKDSAWAGSKIVCYVVPAISSVERLPDSLPPDGTIGDRLTIVAAQGEFEPASFVVFARQNVDRFEVGVGDLKSGTSRIPAANVDVKVVKCWYQAGTAWHSYFADPTHRELVPELLLNDDALIKVVRETQDNYLRVDYPEGSRYVWVSYPARADRGLFNHDTEPVSDVSRLRPVKLVAGQGKQFWITVKIPDDAESGLYEGSLSFSIDGKSAGKMALTVRVLPFALPTPRTYYDLDKEFYCSIYNHCNMATHLALNGGDIKQAERKLSAEMANMRDHNLSSPLIRGYRGGDIALLRRELELMKETGLSVRPLFGAAYAFCDYGWMHAAKDDRDPRIFDKFTQNVDTVFALVQELFGHHDIYAIGWDEPGKSTLIAERVCWEYIHEKGGRVMSTSKDWHFNTSGYNEDFSNYGGFMKPESAKKWHAVGGRITNYAGPHTGPENPDYMRRAHGMRLYMAGFDGTCNYQYYEGRPNIWNEFDKGTYRSFCMVYPTRDGVIDTLAWEGFREGIDDIRYATKLKQLAQAAIDSGPVDQRYAGKKALQWLANLDADRVDLNTMRLEMIRIILGLIEITGGRS